MANRLTRLLAARATSYSKIRDFFAQRNVLEVETPLLLPTANPAPQLENFYCHGLYLQSSPEFGMKYLLSLGSGDIYQICKAFRKNERGRLHNEEFTLLEWYRLDFNHHQLMDEMEELLGKLLTPRPALRYSYQEIFEQVLHINPHVASLAQIKHLASQHKLPFDPLQDNLDDGLQLLFTHLVEPYLKQFQLVFIFDYPASQAMLARLSLAEYPLAARFEVYYEGIELANGFHELNDLQELQRRFNSDLAQRKRLGLPEITIDSSFLVHLANLPNCAGVALGLDRLLLIATQNRSLDDVLPLRQSVV